MSIEKYAAIIGLIATIPIYKGWLFELLIWNKSRKLSSLKTQLEMITKLKDDLSYLMTYIGQAILVVLAIVASAQVFEIFSLRSGNDISSIFISITSLIAYLFALNRLGILTKVREYDKYSNRLKKSIAKQKA